MSRAWFVVAVCVAGGCGDDNKGAADAAQPDVPAMCPAQQPPYAMGVHTYYLNFEGQALMPGDDNSLANTTPLIPNPVTVPRFYDNIIGDRTASIAAIVGVVERALAPYSINVVTTRPPNSDYWMTVLGGTSQNVIGTPDVGSVAPGRCMNDDPNSVSLVFDLGAMGPDTYAYFILSDFGALLGMAVTTDPGDCMCRANGCPAMGPAQVCSFGTAATVDPMSPCGITHQNEQRYLATELGCR